MHKCKLMFKNQALKNKSDKLQTIFNPSHETVNEVTVVYLNEL